MCIGQVKWYNTKKGYGFIQPEDGGKDVFVHATKLEEKGIKKLNDGQKVSYELYDDRGRIAAGDIELLS
jgi:cold shock protein